jgi:ketopantoate hydroxymethyltransferase
MKNNRKTVADLRALKGKRQLTMLFVDNVDEAAAASAAGIDVLSIIDPLWTPQMREAAGDCFVQVGLLYGQLCTYEDYLRAAHAAMMKGGDACYCAASLDTIAKLSEEGLPIISHVGLIPPKQRGQAASRRWVRPLRARCRCTNTSSSSKRRAPLAPNSKLCRIALRLRSRRERR